jgi:nucleoside-diphosphate-sugar epimerase
VWHFCRGYVEDVANAIVLAALDTRSGNRIYNVGEKDPYSESEWIQRIGQIAGWNNKIIKLPYDKLPAHLKEPSVDWQQDLTISTQLIRDELNYKELYSPNDAMRISIDWLRTHKPAQVDNSFNYDAEDNASKNGSS